MQHRGVDASADPLAPELEAGRGRLVLQRVAAGRQAGFQHEVAPSERPDRDPDDTRIVRVYRHIDLSLGVSELRRIAEEVYHDLMQLLAIGPHVNSVFFR